MRSIWSTEAAIGIWKPFALALAVGLGLGASVRAADAPIEQWGIYELALDGPAAGNPFLEVQLSAEFSGAGQRQRVSGFYDGDGTYCIRFMPGHPGEYSYRTRSNHPALDGRTGSFRVVAPSPGNHGPVRVHQTFHFAYADGTPFKPLGTTCYAWIHQPEDLQAQTLQTLDTAPFNKLRMCVFPKRYRWNEDEPQRYPFAGTPPRDWDFERFNPAFFRHLEQQVQRLQAMGIEADLILFHPYDKGHWGFDRMTDEQDDRYVRYVVSRLSAFRNVWWSLANEYDFMNEKQETDWDRMFRVIQDNDPYGHLRSIHNGFQIYNHTHPWVTHASIQNGSAAEDAGRAVLYRDVYRKPIVLDEVKYEGDISRRWGNLTPQQMVHRFWQGTIAGTYVSHGETYLHEHDILWWSKGGVLRGQSPPRLAFLRHVLQDSPAGGIEPIDKWQHTQIAGEPGQYYLIYFGKDAPPDWSFQLPQRGLEEGMQFEVEILDTWNMTCTAVEGIFTVREKNRYLFQDQAEQSIQLPGLPWLALRIRRVL